jgi:sugar/nucleoside kinase (ribokinase family)
VTTGTRRGLFAGLATLDLVHTLERPLGPDEKTLALRQEIAAGGPAANAAVTFAALGGDASLLTALGAHPLAGFAAAELISHDVRVVDATPDAANPPAVSAVRVIAATGARSVSSVNAAFVQATPPAAVAELTAAVDVVLVDGHHPQLALAAAHAARAVAVPVLLDAGSWKPVLTELLPLVSGAICSAAFAAVSTVDEVHARGVPWVAVTHGADPIEWSTGDRSGTIAVPQVPARDTLGAGDAFHGAAAFALAGKAGWLDSLRFAAEVAAVRVQHPGPRDWLTQLSALRPG